MSDVWDRASEVIARRLGAVAGIVLAFVWLPGVIRGGVQLAATPAGFAQPVGAGAGLAALIGLAATVLAMLGHLALVAMASDPALSLAAALGVARRRFWPYVGIMLPVVAAVLLLVIPVTLAIVAADPGMAAMRAGSAPPLSPGLAAFVGLYGIAVIALALWAEARLLLILVPVIVNERLGLGSYRRALALTRGRGWRIVGVLLLFAVLVAVATLAVQGVVGVALRLMLGAERIGLVLAVTAAAVGLVAGVALAVASAFSARLYRATAEPRGAA